MQYDVTIVLLYLFFVLGDDSLKKKKKSLFPSWHLLLAKSFLSW